MRVQGVVLEHHRDPALPGVQRRHVAIADEEVPRRRDLEAGHEPQERGLAAARGTDEDRELVVGDHDVDLVHGPDGLLPGLEDLEQLLGANLCHCVYPFTAPTVRPRRKYRWNARNTTNIGSAAITLPAISEP